MLEDNEIVQEYRTIFRHTLTIVLVNITYAILIGYASIAFKNNDAYGWIDTFLNLMFLQFSANFIMGIYKITNYLYTAPNNRDSDQLYYGKLAILCMFFMPFVAIGVGIILVLLLL